MTADIAIEITSSTMHFMPSCYLQKIIIFHIWEVMDLLWPLIGKRKSTVLIIIQHLKCHIPHHTMEIYHLTELSRNPVHKHRIHSADKETDSERDTKELANNAGVPERRFQSKAGCFQTFSTLHLTIS